MHRPIGPSEPISWQFCGNASPKAASAPFDTRKRSAFATYRL
jgi:hypothetical protein